jgi:type IV pilus assembly protein PilM
VVLNITKKITTLYISDTGIRLMVTRGKRIIKLAEAPLDMNLAETTAKVREAELVAKIRHLFKAHKIKTKKVIIGLSGLRCLSRPVVLPQLPKAMLDEAMKREAKRVLPVPVEQLYISWQILSTIEGKMQAFLVAIPLQIADTPLGVMQQVGLKPYLMDIKPLALARLVKEATAIIVDVQSKEFDIVIMVDGIPQPIRTVPFPEEPEALSLQDKLLIVKDELKRTVEFYNSTNPDKPIQPDVNMYVSGEADEPEFSESLANELGYRVLPLTSPLKCPKQLDTAHYLVNIGLALKELGKEAGPLLPNLNALPVPYQPQQISWRRVMVLPATAVAVGIIAIMVMTIQDSAAGIDFMQSQLATTNHSIEQRQSQRQSQAERIAALEQQLAEAKATRDTLTTVLDSFTEQGEVINGDLEAAVDNLVYGIKLRIVDHSSGGMKITGQAPSEVEILGYARNLDATGRFAEVTIASIMRVEHEGDVIEGESEVNEGMDFTLSLRLKETE